MDRQHFRPQRTSVIALAYEVAVSFNVFISWSGEISRSVARIVHEWLPGVIQDANPFMSDKDIEAGTRGLQEIADQLRDIRVGIICVTSSNQGAPWLNFEAGALSKLNENTYVIPLALDLDNGQVKFPIGQFQAKQFNRQEMLEVIRAINNSMKSPLSQERLITYFNRDWPLLERDIEEIKSQAVGDSEPEDPQRTSEDMLEELVNWTREQPVRPTQPSAATPARPAAMNAQVLVTEVALNRLATAYREEGPMSLKRLVELASVLDEDDWNTIETSPFLVWYLATYRGLKRPEVFGASDLNDVPF